MKGFCAFLLAAGVLLVLTTNSSSQSKAVPNPVQVASCERKLQHLETNAAQAHPDPSPTEFSEQEVNAYFAS